MIRNLLRRGMTVLAGVTIVFTAGFAIGASVNVQPENAVVRFEIQYLKFFKVTGCFNNVIGGLILEEATNRLLAIKGEIAIESINTGIGFRDEQLKSESYFNQSLFPHIYFESGKIVYRNESEFEIVGTITIKGIVEPIRFIGRTERIPLEADQGSKIVHLASGTIDRYQFGIGPVEYYYPEGLLISRKVIFSIHTETCQDAEGREAICPEAFNLKCR